MSDYSDILLPFGQDEQGRMVSVDMVERGAACNCICPQCRKSLLAKKGEIRCHHFAHAGDGCGSGALETSLHKMSKQIVCDEGKIWLPEIQVRHPPVYQPGATFTLTSIPLKAGWFEGVPSLETRVGNIQPDVTLIGDHRSVALEIYVTHAVSQEKRAKVREAKVDMVEVDLSYHQRTFELPVLRNYVLKEAPRFWVYSNIEAEAQTALRQKWIVENDRREAAKLAEIERQRAAMQRLQRARDFAAARAADEALIAEERERRASEEAAEAAAARRERRMREAVASLPGLRRTALLRPRIIMTPHLTPGCFCGTCEGTAWHRTSEGWACNHCVPAATRRVAA